MQSQITEKESEITSLEGQLSTTQETLTSTQSQLATVQGQLEVATARIEELEEQIAIKPGRDLSEYTWEEIVESSELAKLNKTEFEYLIGQTKELDIGEKWPINMQLVGIAHDDLSNGNGKAGFTFISKETAGYVAAYNECPGNYAQHTLYTTNYVNKINELRNKIPQYVREHIKTVNKRWYHDNSGTKSSKVMELDLWTPSEREIFGTSEINEDGEQYQYFKIHSDQDSIYHYPIVNRTSPASWWLRTPTTRQIKYVSANTMSKTCTGSHGLVLCFCI